MRSYVRDVHGILDPVRNAMVALHLAFAIEGDAINDYRSTRDAASLERFRRARSVADSVFQGLAEVVPRLESDAQTAYDTLLAAHTRWHASVEEALASPTDASEALAARIRSNHVQMIIAAAEFDRAILAFAQRLRAQLVTASRQEFWISIALVVLALGAALVAARIGRQLDAFAEMAERRREMLVELVDARARLTRGFSHDIKNPLGAADGQAALLEGDVLGPLTAEQRTAIARIRRSVGSALRLVEDLVTVARIEGAPLEVKRVPVRPDELAVQVAEEHHAPAEEAGLRLEIRIPGRLPLIRSDPDRIRQILGNLLSNAIKYTPAGGRVTVLGRASRAGGRRWAVLEVADTGPGIPPELQETIFEEYTRLGAGERRGTGLGLYISRQLAHALGGEIRVQSAVGRGSRFELWLPVEPS